MPRNAVELYQRLGIETPVENQQRARAVANANRNDWPYPWAYMPQDGRPFSRRAAVATPAFGAANRVTLATYEVPTGYMGVLVNVLAFYAGTGFINGSGDIVWDIDVNTPLGVSVVGGYALPDYSAFTLSLGNAIQPWPLDGGWVLGEGDIVRVKARTVATVGTGAPNFLYGGLMGWVWPVQSRHGRAG